MAQAKKLNSGSWRIRITHDGKRMSFTAETKKSAELKASAWLLSHADSDGSPEITLETATEQYISSRASVLSPTTLNSYYQYQRLHFQSLMGAEISKIKTADIQGQINELSARLSAKTIDNIVTFYLGVLDFFDVYIPKKKLRFPRREKLEYATPDTARIKSIIAATKGTNIEIAVLLALWCSLRMGEIIGLKWSCVSEDKIVINNTIVYSSGIRCEKPPKTAESTRTLPMPSYIWERLQNVPKNSEYVVPMHPNKVREKFHRILAENGIPECRFHDLRHANASVMLMLGIPDKYAMARGGWSTPDVYKGVYVQTYEDENQAVADKIDGYFTKLL